MDYPADPSPLHRKVVEPSTRPVRLEHRTCGYVVTVSATDWARFAGHLHRHLIFCDGCAKMLKADQFDLVEEPMKEQ